jgi:hypothetical protein
MTGELEMIWKEVVVTGSRYCLSIFAEELRIAGAPDEIQTKNLPNTSLEGYCFTTLLSYLNVM